jgi:hypothetical protein
MPMIMRLGLMSSNTYPCVHKVAHHPERNCLAADHSESFQLRHLSGKMMVLLMKCSMETLFWVDGQNLQAI